MAKKSGKVHKVMHEFKHGTLRRGTGRPGQKAGKVGDRKQAIAIALSEARKVGERAGKGVGKVQKAAQGQSKARERRLSKAAV